MSERTVSEDEKTRLAAVQRLRLLDTPAEERFDRITRLAKKAIHAPISHVSLIDDHRQWFKSTQGFSLIETSRDDSICAHTILNDDPLVINDIREDPRFSENALTVRDPHIRFYAGYPVKGPDGSKVGTLCVMDTHPRRLSEDDLRTLRDLAILVEKEFHVVHLSEVQTRLILKLEESERAALVDPLTRLWNRKGIMEIFVRELVQGRRRKSSLGVILADLDRFKGVNDTHGHLAGDEALRQVAQVLRASVRPYDAVGRYGGEEFLIVLPSCEMGDAAQVAERVRKNVARTLMEVGDAALSLTVSLGVTAAGPRENVDLEDLIGRADRALYRAKDEGRDRAVSAEPGPDARPPSAK